MRNLIKRAVLNTQRGFTLLELLAVMAIVGVLAGVVYTSVSGTGDASRDAQAAQDSGTVTSAAADYFGSQGGVDVLTPLLKNVLDSSELAEMEISSQWPEDHSTDIFPLVFPETTAEVTAVSFLNAAGAIITFDDDDDSGTAEITLTEVDLVERFNSIDFDKLVDGGFLADKPASSTKTTSDFANYLWLFEKSGDNRNVAVFKLTAVQVDTKLTDTEEDDTAAMVYQSIN